MPRMFLGCAWIYKFLTIFTISFSHSSLLPRLALYAISVGMLSPSLAAQALVFLKQTIAATDQQTTFSMLPKMWPIVP